MKHSSFRAYDIRGIIGKDLLIEDVYRFGKAIVKWLELNNILEFKVVLARDGRNSSPIIYDHLYTAFADCNINVYGAGITTTPQLYFEEQQLKLTNPDSCSIGIMITASHNDGDHNGFKILKNSKSLTALEIQDLYNIFINQPLETIKNICHVKSKPSNYLKHLVKSFKDLENFELPLLIDCANAPAGQVISVLCSMLNFKNVTLVANDLDGNFRCHRPDPTQNYGRIFFAEKSNGTIGIAFDGDADRLVVIDEIGNLVRGDQLLAIFALYNNTKSLIVADIKCATILTDFIFSKHGIKTIWSPSGHGHIKQKVNENKALIGGELSGHYCFTDRPAEIYGFDDGIYSFLRLLQIIKNYGSINSLTANLPNFFSTGELRIKIPEHLLAKQLVSIINKDLVEIADSYDTIDGVRAKIKNNCVTLRASNTENVISMSIESISKLELDNTYNLINSLITKNIEQYEK